MGLVSLISTLLNPEQAVTDKINNSIWSNDNFTAVEVQMSWEEPVEETATSSENIIADNYDVLRCSCISFIRKLSQFQPPAVKQAIDIPVKSQIPIPGAWVLFGAGPMYSKYGHAAYVKSVGTSTISIIEKNFKKCAITAREIEKQDSNIRGYYY